MAVDSGGVRPDAVDRALKRRPALVYLQSGPHSPSGAALSEPRRRAIAELVRASNVPLVEDAALADLAWEDAPAPLAAWCGDAAVALVGSLGKTFWGGLRIGLVRAPEPVALRFARVKATHDLGSSAATQLLAGRLLDAAAADGFLERRRTQLRERYELLSAELRRCLAEWEWTPPRGGMSLWVRLPGGADAEAFAQAALHRGVAVATQSPLSCSGTHRDRLRLSFSGGPDTLTEGVARLAAAWHGRK